MDDISLVVCTLGERLGDLEALLSSLAVQSQWIKEVIVVDQHSNPAYVQALLEKFSKVVPLRYTRSEKGLSRARNQGLPLATGSLVAFPDDDCIYPPGLIEWVIAWFRAYPEYDVLAVGSQDADGSPSGNRWIQDACDIRPLNAFRTTFSPSLFLRSAVAKRQVFDVNLGVGSGTRYGSGEETDYILRILGNGSRGRFERKRYIIHPRRDMLSGGASPSRAEAYGFGMGHLLHRHVMPKLWSLFLVYDLARAAISLSMGKKQGSALCVAHAKGLWLGYSDRAFERGAL